MSRLNQTLPRHTNLATQGRRISAFLVDFALLVAFTLVFYFGAIKWICKSSLDNFNSLYYKEELNTGLFVDIGGTTTNIESDSSFEKFRDVLSYYYMNYLTGEDIEVGKEASQNKDDLIEGKRKSEYYTVSWFNQNILEIGEDPDNETDEGYFTYKKDNLGNYIISDFGIPKDSAIVPAYKVNTFLQTKYQLAARDFVNQDFVLDIVNQIGFISTIEIVASTFLGSLVTYLLLPIIFKNGKTLGKKINNLGLANKEGYKIKNYQLLLRLIPLYLVLISLLVPIWTNLVFVFIVFLVIFIVSFALAMASPKKSSLHDYVASTIVVDMSTSILFNSMSEEEDYIFKEDGIEEGEENNE